MSVRMTGSLIAGVFVCLFILSTFFGSWYTIDATDRGVLLSNGAVASDTAIEPGLHWKLPFVQAVDVFSVQSHSSKFDKIKAYSFDQQVADIVISVNWHVPSSDVVKVREEYVNEDNLVNRVLNTKVPTIFKNVFGTYTAQVSIQQRPKLAADFFTALTAGINAPIVIDSIQIEDISFSDAFDQANEQKQLADVAVQQLQQKQKQAEVQAQITVTNAKAQADARVAQANADAQAIKLKGDAEAGVINARGQALKDNPGVTALILAEKWNGQLPATMPPNGSVPFIDVNPPTTR